jgi:hypothetical protein
MPVKVKKIINSLKDTIMKAMELTPMAVARYESSERTANVMKAVKKALTSTIKFLMVISPVYPQVAQPK